MGGLARWRAHAGLWVVTAALAAAAVFVASTTGPVTGRIEDRAIRTMIAAAPALARDVTVVTSITALTAEDPEHRPGAVERNLRRALPEPLAGVLAQTWGYRYTTVSPFEQVGAVITGEGVRPGPTREYAPLVSFHEQPGLESEVVLVEGRMPGDHVGEPEAEEDRPPADLVEVAVSTTVAEGLGLEVGREYLVHPGVVVGRPNLTATPLALRVQVVGIFEPADPQAPVWAHLEPLLQVVTVTIPVDLPPYLPTTRAGLLTDDDGFDAVASLAASFRPEVAARARFDETRMDRHWPAQAVPALARVQTAPELTGMRLLTELDDLLPEYLRQQVAARSLVAVAGAGLVAVLVGLLLLAARLIAERRRTELTLLRARGGSLPRIGRMLLLEGAWLLVPAVVVGWLVHRLVVAAPWVDGRTFDPALLLARPEGPPAVLAAVTGAVSLLVVPAVGVTVARGTRGGRTTRTTGVRRRTVPVRLTVELSVLLLGVLGVVVLRQRGLAQVEVDLFLAAVPVLLALAAGVVALRVYPWPMRALAAAAARGRGAVAFLGLARSGRATAGSGWALLVLVLAAAVGGFAGAVQQGVETARDEGAVAAVGAHLRVTGDRLPAEMVDAVAALPGVTTVAAVSRDAYLVDRLSRPPYRNQPVLVVDAHAYQRVLDALGRGHRLPEEVLSAGAGEGPVPVLASSPEVRRADLSVQIGAARYPVTTVGDTSSLPGPDRRQGWWLVPAAALDEPLPVSELLVAGVDVDPAAVREVAAALGGEVVVTSVADHRAALERSGFNEVLTLAFVAGTVGGAAGAMVAVTLTLVLRAAERGRTLSLLRTTGLSTGQARRLLLVELVPSTVWAVAAGVATGVLIPVVAGPALGLDGFTGGVPLPSRVDPLAAGVVALLVVLLVVVAVAVEAAVNRRLGLGRVLRVE